MPTIKRGWHNPVKQIAPTHARSCPICHKKVKSLEAHMRSKHKGNK